MRDFEDRTVVVTGGTGFLGTAVVRVLLDRGATVVVPAARPEEIQRFPFREQTSVRLVEDVDLADEADVDRLFDAVDGLWASVHLAGGFAMGPVEDTDAETWRAMIETNATTCFLSSRAAVRRIRARVADQPADARPGGRLVNVTAKPALVPTGHLAAYAASKAAVAGLTHSLSEELADESIWVNAVVPSVLDTPVNRQAMPRADHDAWPSLEDVAQTVVFLASPANRTTRGALVPVYGRS